MQSTLLFTSELNIFHITYMIHVSFIGGVFKNCENFTSAQVRNKIQYRKKRPISILSIFSQIYGTILSIHLSDFTEEHDLWGCQIGFRMAHSTTHAVVTENITRSLNTGKIVVEVFDTVYHDIILNKYHWFQRYFSFGITDLITYNITIPNLHIIRQAVELGLLLFIL